MKRRTRETVEAELRWYFQESAADLGLRGLPIEPQAGGKQDNPGPGASQMRAVRLQRIVRAALDDMAERERHLLAVSYELRRVDPSLASTWGVAANAMARCGAHTRADRIIVAGMVRDAHDLYESVRQRHAQEHLDAVRMARDAGQARRAAWLTRCRETSVRATEKAAIEVAAWLESMGLVEDGRVMWDGAEVADGDAA